MYSLRLPVAAVLFLSMIPSAEAWVGYRAFYADLSWSPDSRRIAFTARYDADNAFYPDEAVVWLDIADSSSRPIVLTPPLHCAAVNRRLQLAACSQSWGLTVFDLAEVRLTHSSPLFAANTLVPVAGGYETEWRDPEIEDLKWSPDSRRLAGMGYDVGLGTNILLGWQLGDSIPLQLATHCAGFFWHSDDTLFCRSAPASFGADSAESFVAVAVGTGHDRPASRAEYESLQPRPTAINLPEGCWHPQRLGTDSIFFHHESGFGVMAADGSGLRRIRFPRNGHHPRWVSDSILLFRVGRPGEEPLPFSVGWGDEERWQPPLDEEFYFRDALWFCNLSDGQLQPADSARLEPVSRPVDTDTAPVMSPDGKLSARFEDEGRTIVLAIANRFGRELRRVELRGLIP